MILSNLGQGGHLYSFDQDINAIKRYELEAKQHHNWTLVHRNFAEIWNFCEEKQIKINGGIVMDLGLSSIQLDDPSRGFSFQQEAELDMRLNPDAELRASDIINRYKESEIADILYKYGEERLSRHIAKAIINRRPINSTSELADLITKIYGRKTPKKHWKIHPATKSFQALRIYVNKELEALEQALDPLMLSKYLEPGAKVAAISFHSLEDRIVKNAFRELLRSSKSGRSQAQVWTSSKKPLIASPEEIRLNPRSRSAKMRVLTYNPVKNS